jgi:hypothetical protein
MPDNLKLGGKSSVPGMQTLFLCALRSFCCVVGAPACLQQLAKQASSHGGGTRSEGACEHTEEESRRTTLGRSVTTQTPSSLNCGPASGCTVPPSCASAIPSVVSEGVCGALGDVKDSPGGTSQGGVLTSAEVRRREKVVMPSPDRFSSLMCRHICAASAAPDSDFFCGVLDGSLLRTAAARDAFG